MSKFKWEVRNGGSRNLIAVYHIYKNGKFHKEFDSRDEAHDYVQDCLEDDRVYAHLND